MLREAFGKLEIKDIWVKYKHLETTSKVRAQHLKSERCLSFQVTMRHDTLHINVLYNYVCRWNLLSYIMKYDQYPDTTNKFWQPIIKLMISFLCNEGVSHSTMRLHSCVTVYFHFSGIYCDCLYWYFFHPCTFCIPYQYFWNTS